MKKILLIVGGFDKTGISAVFMNLVRNLPRDEYQFDALYFDDSYDYFKSEFVAYGGKVLRVDPKTRTTFARKMLRYFSNKRHKELALKFIKKHGPYDVMHSFVEYRSSPFFEAAFISEIPIRIYHSNNMMKIGGNLINRFLSKKEQKNCLKYMTHLIGCSHQSCESAFPGFEHQIINNPYDSNLFYYTSSNNVSSVIKIVQTGNFFWRKNQLFTIDVINALNKKQKCEIHFIGENVDNQYFSSMKKLIEKRQLFSNVVFHSFDCNQLEVFKDCSYFILPSIHEAFGIVLIEAQASGLTCFASDATPQSVDVGGCIRLPLSIGPEEWAEHIYNHFKKTSGKKHFFNCEAFDNHNILQKYVQIYNSFQLKGGELNCEKK